VDRSELEHSLRRIGKPDGPVLTIPELAQLVQNISGKGLIEYKPGSNSLVIHAPKQFVSEIYHMCRKRLAQGVLYEIRDMDPAWTPIGCSLGHSTISTAKYLEPGPT
jgi:hypothetical protein